MLSSELRLALEPTGLLGEISSLPGEAAATYYGFNVTKTDREPIDQVHGFIAAKRIQEGGGGPFFAFVAGLFEVVNCTTVQQREELVIRNSALEAAKETLFRDLASRLNVATTIVTTKDMWNDGAYWLIVEELLRDRERYSKRALVRDTLKWYGTEEEAKATIQFADALSGFAVPDSLLKTVGDWPAAFLYTPLEVAEAKYFADVHGVNAKIGHMEERTYDRHIAPFMSVVHLRQPSCLKSTRLRPRTVTPYIDKARRDQKTVIAFSDSRDDISKSLTQHFTDDGSVFALSPVAGEILNPVLDKALYAVECARANGQTVALNGVRMNSGHDLLTRVCRGEIQVSEIRDVLPELVSRWVIGR